MATDTGLGTDVVERSVSFVSDGLRLSGHLREPADGQPLPALVFTGPFSGVKEQVVGTYATRLADAGYVTLAFDHRNFGESEGEPRQHEDSAGKLADLRDAVSWLSAREGVDPARIGVVGVCLGGGYALRFAGFDPRVSALATVAGGYNDPAAMRAGMGADSYRGVLRSMLDIAAEDQRSGSTSYVAAVAPEGEEAVMGGAEPFEYYGTERSTSPGWVNRVTRTSVYELLTADLARGADFISPTPWLLVHGRTDAYCSPDGAQATFDRASDPKRLVWLDTTNHIDLYDVPEFVEPAIAEITAWFNKHL
ncbi:MAG: alpha/beta hydrolase [Actinobacteria bacterium]|nr:alpha/beta hydrolase [Actinomycetota bacterium]